MRLTVLDPLWRHWHHDAVSDRVVIVPDTSSAKAIGCSFNCPIHGVAHRISVDFANPFDGATSVVRKNLWQRTGDTFETLTLTPSIDYTKYDNGTMRDPSCWHGHVTNGEIR